MFQENLRRGQTHNHEILGSTQLAEQGNDRHNHRFATVSGQVIPFGNTHIHAVSFQTDFAGHLHFFQGRTGPAIPVGGGKHVHALQGVTSINDGHRHAFRVTTLIENPLA